MEGDREIEQEEGRKEAGENLSLKQQKSSSTRYFWIAFNEYHLGKIT